MSVTEIWYEGGSEALAYHWHFKFASASGMTIFRKFVRNELKGDWNAINMTEPTLPLWVTKSIEYDERKNARKTTGQWNDVEEDMSHSQSGKYETSNRDYHTPRRNKGKGKGGIQCYNCGEFGHISRDCPTRTYGKTPRSYESPRK